MLDVIWATTSDLIWSVDLPDFRLTWWNRNLEESLWDSFGLMPERGMAPGDLFRYGHEGLVWIDFFGRALNEGELRFERRDPFGADRTFRIIPVVARGETTGLAIFGQRIGERLEAGSARRETGRSSEHSFMAVPDALYLETLAGGRIVHSNAAFENVFGFSREETVGASSSDLALWVDCRRREKLVQKVHESGFVLDFEMIGRKRNGETFPARVSAYLVQSDGETLVVSTVRNVGGLRETQDKVRLLQFSVDHVDELICLTDPDGRVIFINDYGCRRMGCTREEILGRPGSDLFAKTGLGPKDLHECLRRQGSATDEVEMLTRTGELWPGEVTMSSLEFEGQEYICLFTRDITERKNSGRDLAEALEGVKHAQISTIEVLSSITDLHDPYTAGHQRCVAKIALAIAEKLGIEGDRKRGLEVAALLHDIGKASVPIEILSFPGDLTPARRRLVQKHAEAGYDLLSPITFPWPVAEMVLQHHEREDGSGYPRGLTGERLLLEAKILAVADTVEAMGAHRPHRSAFGADQIRSELLRLRGTAYDADVVDAFLSLDSQPDSPDGRLAGKADTRT